MPNPVVGIVGSAIGGMISSGRGAKAQERAADSAAEASAYSTDRQIEAAKEARDEAVKAAKAGNKIATGAYTDAARARAIYEGRGETGSRNALLAGNRGAADAVVGNSLTEMRARTGASGRAQQALVGNAAAEMRA